MRWPLDKDLYEHFNNLKERPFFFKRIAALRKVVNVPAGGVKLKDKEFSSGWRSHISEAKLPLMEKEILSFLEESGLGPHLKETVATYVVFGEHVPENLDSLMPAETIGCSLEEGRDSIILGIYPEATLNRVYNFLKQHWDEIEAWQMRVAYEHEARLKGEKMWETETQPVDRQKTRFQTKVKSKPKRQRDERIMELYDWGIIKASGVINAKNARQFLVDRSIETEDLSDIKKGLDHLGYELPKTETIKKVIERRSKLRKS